MKEILDSHQVTVWDRVKANPDLQDLDSATASLRSMDIGCVVGLGGGSALDSAKVLATTIPSPTKVTLCEVFRNQAGTEWAPRLPLVAIPTTSGTGAEVTPFATVWDHDEHKKHSLAGDFVYPDVALLDATLALTLGEEDTLYPALDAISHALESLWNKNCTPVSRAFAFQALALSKDALPLVMKEPSNLKVRRDMQNASVLSGLAISQTRTAVAHAISYSLTAHCGVPHGLACSFSLADLIVTNIDRVCKDKNERNLLEDIREILIHFNLKQQVFRYITPEALSHLPGAINLDRSNNYIDEIHPSMIRAIFKSLAKQA